MILDKSRKVLLLDIFITGHLADFDINFFGHFENLSYFLRLSGIQTSSLSLARPANHKTQA
jgi:hypothetical protein